MVFLVLNWFYQNAYCCRREVANMTLEELRNKKREFGYSNQQISDLSGVPMGTVQKIFSGKTAAPRYATLKALEAVFVTEKPDQNSGRERL